MINIAGTFLFLVPLALLILTGSGTGGLEAAAVNVLSPGDKILSVSIGVFGDRFASIAKEFGADVVSLKFEWGMAADPEEVRQAIKDNPDVKAVLVTHNETSTGVTNDLGAISKVVKEAGKLLNDPELYNSLTEAAKELSRLTAEFRQLVAKWKKEGVNIKLK